MEENDAIGTAPKLPDDMLFVIQFGNLKSKLRECQIELDNFLDKGEILANSKGLPVKFFNRVNAGRLADVFTEFATLCYQYEDGLKKALKKDAPDES